MLLCGDNYILHSENSIVQFSYKLRDFIDVICVPFVYYLQLTYAYHNYYSNLLYHYYYYYY